MQYEIWLDLINYRQYTGNVERELTDFIFGSKFTPDYWEVPKEWEGKLLEFPWEHDGYGIMTLCGIEGKVYSPEEVEKFGLEGESYEGAPENYHCFRIFWKFDLEDDQASKKMAEFLTEKSQEFMLTKPKSEGSMQRFNDKKEIPIEIYGLEKRLIQ